MKLENITKTFLYKNGLKVKLLNNISFEISNGKVSSILASAGSGKSTLLKIICGIETADSEVVGKGKFCFIPSKPSSFPWLNVQENILFADENLEIATLDSLLHSVGLDGYEKHFPINNSLGFRFRIALARAIATKPDAIVLDEPFNEMDLRTKFEMLQLLVSINKEMKTTILLSTSNLSDALLVSHNILLMKKDSSGNLPLREIEYQSDDILERLKSDSYEKYLSEEESILKNFASQQTFTISL